MDDSMIKSATILALWVWASLSIQGVFSIITSIVATVYFASMLKIRVVNEKYDGSWRAFFKSWFS